MSGYAPPPLNQQPSWLRNESTHDDVQPLNSNVQQTSQTHLTPEFIQRAKQIHSVLRIITILLCLLLASTAIVGFKYITDIDTSGKVFICAYMLFFAILLFIFELNEFKKIEYIDHFYRRNFGFIYKAMGKALFIIFVAFLSFGLGDPQTLTMLTGLSLAGFGTLQVGLYLKYPEYFDDLPEGS